MGLVEALSSLNSLACLLPCAPLPSVDGIMLCTTPEIPTLEQVLEKMQVNNSTKAKISEPLEWLIKSFICDRQMHVEASQSMKTELDFHQGIYKKYVYYT